jgi:hypothetical protein
MKGWRGCLLEHSIVPIQQFAYTTGKNATDGAMIIDAMDLLYTGRFSSFCLVTSDSDFTRLASRIREQGIQVYWFGNKHNTHWAFIATCNNFVYLNALPVSSDEKEEEATAPGASASASAPPPAQPTFSKPATSNIKPLAATQQSLAYRPASPIRNKAPAPAPPTPRAGTALDRTAIEALRKAITNSALYDSDGFVRLAEVGSYLIKLSPDLNARNYGFPRLLDFVLASGIVKTDMRESGDKPPLALVKLKE